ncbi:MAG: hypothetical protein ACREIQ_00275 [Nitrospiria bacterium]
MPLNAQSTPQSPQLAGESLPAGRQEGGRTCPSGRRVQEIKVPPRSKNPPSKLGDLQRNIKTKRIEENSRTGQEIPL